MASSPSHLEISAVDSTSRLFSRLDLVGLKLKNMDFMDIDKVMDVPDTPDRLTSWQKNTMNVGDAATNGDLLNRGILNGLRGSHRLKTNTGNNKKLYSHHQRDVDISDEIKDGSSFIVSASDRTPVSDDFSKYRMRCADQNLKHEVKLSMQTHNTEPMPYENKLPSHMPFASRGSANHLAGSAKLCNSSSNITEGSASGVKVEGGNRGKMNDIRQKMPPNGFFRARGRDARRNMLPGHGNSNAEKDVSAEIPPRSFTSHDVDHVLDVSEQQEYIGKPERPCTVGRFGKVGAKEVGVSVLSGGSIRQTRSNLQFQATDDFFPLCDVDRSSKASGNGGKQETDSTVDGVGLNTSHPTVNDGFMGGDKGKRVDLCSISSTKIGQSVPIQLNAMPSRKTGQRKLVRNGCISPYNIAKSKGTSENYNKTVKDGKLDENDEMACNNVSDGSSSYQMRIISPGSEDNQIDRIEGKAIMNKNMPENDYDARTRSLLSREEDSVTGDANGDIFRSAEEIGGWRGTRNRSKSTNLSSSHDIRGYSKIKNGGIDSYNQSHRSGMEDRDYMTKVNACPEADACILLHDVGPSTHPMQTSSNIIFESNPENERHKGKQKLMKRQRKSATACSSIGECSSSTIADPEVSFIRSSGQLSSMKPTRTRNSQHCGNLFPVIEVDESCTPESIFIDHQDSGRTDGDHSSGRARQVEADEMLARELQEQFYSELPGPEGEEMDATLAWTLQHEENDQRLTSLGSQHLSSPRDLSVGDSYRSSSSRTFRSSSTRPTNRARGHTSARMQQLRRSMYGNFPTVSARGRSFQFPPHMNLEMRIDLLEALEAAVGNRNNAAMAGHFFQVQRDFNENDYEMLLALDDDNHRHVGASVNQINSLPQSTIQTDNFEEACAICLETPSIGDTIRHLPCVHKFHKECIDSWLRRKSSCPICKSSIT